MTDIPGTGKISLPKPPETLKQVNSKLVSVVNVSEIKKKAKESPQDLPWYHQLKYWILLGLGESLLFVIFSLLNRRFLILALLGPLVGVVSWYLIKFFSRYSKNFDAFSK